LIIPLKRVSKLVIRILDTGKERVYHLF
jgi:hypothetical protein